MSHTGTSVKAGVRVRMAAQSATPSNAIVGDIFNSDGTSRAAGLWMYNGTDWQPYSIAPVSVKAFISATSAPGAGGTIVFDTELEDTHNAYNNGTGIFTVPTNLGGYYYVSVSVQTNAGVSEVQVQLNGSTSQYLNYALINVSNGSTIVKASAGDTIKITADSAVTFINACMLVIYKLY